MSNDHQQQTNMDTNKIREALKMAHSAFRENGYAEEDQLAEALAELDKQPSAEPVAWMASDGRHVVSRPNYDDMSMMSREGYPIPLYTHPAKPSGLTVEAAMEVVWYWELDKITGQSARLSTEEWNATLRARLEARANN